MPEPLYEQAKRWATLAGKNVPEMLVDALTATLTSTHTTPVLDKPASRLSDGEVVALANARMEPAQGRRLSRLLEKQGEGALSDADRLELLALMQVYDQLWVRQSEALAESVRRGLRGPLKP